MTAAPPTVSTQDLPALCQAVAARARASQGTFLRLTLLQLAGLVALAAIETAGSSTSSREILDFVVVTLAALLILLRVLSRSWRSERVWHEARATAESLKTVSWRFMMRANPYHEGDAESVLFLRLRQVIEELPDQPVVPVDAPQLTPKMREVRAAPLPVRRAVYASDRIEDQLRWYGEQAVRNDRQSRLWNAVMLFLLLGELSLALARMAGLEIGAIALVATGVAAVSTWMGARDYESLATAYSMAAHELATIRSELDLVGDDEEAWAGFVDDAEKAISREHTSWFASRRR